MAVDGGFAVLRSVRSELDSEPRLAGREIRLAVCDGVVVLSGYVNDYEEWHIAVLAARRATDHNVIAEGLFVRERCIQGIEYCHAVC